MALSLKGGMSIKGVKMAAIIIPPPTEWENWEDGLTGWAASWDADPNAFTIVSSPYGVNGMQTTNYTPPGMDGYSELSRSYQISGDPILISEWRLKFKVTSLGTEQYGPGYELALGNAGKILVAPVSIVVADASQRANVIIAATDHFLGSSALPLNTWVEIVLTINYALSQFTAVVSNLDTPGVISTDTYSIPTTELPINQVNIFQGSLNGGAGDLTPMTVINDDINFVRYGNTTPTPFVSYSLNAATAEFATLNPVSSLAPFSDFTWNGPGGGSYFNSPVLAENTSTYSLAEYVTFTGDYLEMSITAEPGPTYIDTFVRLYDIYQNGWSLQIQNNIGPGSDESHITVYEWTTGIGTPVSTYTLGTNWTTGIKETKIIDNGTNLLFYFDGSLVNTTTSILPYSGTLGPLGSVDITAVNDEKIYSATVVG
jgi:hypothetical protein